MNVRPARLKLMACFAQARADGRKREAQEAEDRKRAISERAKRRRREKAESDALAARLAAMTPVERSNWRLAGLIPDLPVLIGGICGTDRCTVYHINLSEDYAVVGNPRGVWNHERVRSIGGLVIRPQPAMPSGAFRVTIKMLKRILFEMGQTDFYEDK